jgi:uncharacterized membrane protein YhaH (DUF805 family)
MNFPQAIATGFRKYATFSGRAPASEYWYWNLFLWLGSVAAGILDAVLFPTFSLIGPLFSLALLVPNFAVAVRRLHDVDRSGWWLLISFTIIGLIYPLLVWNCTKGTRGSNRFGPDPFEMEEVAAVFE